MYYQCDCGDPNHHHHTLTLANGDDLPLPTFIDINALAKQAVRNVYDGFDGAIEPAGFAATFLALSDAVDKGYGVIEYGRPTRAFADNLKQSAVKFAARKSWQQAQDLAALLDKNGKKRPWKEFQKLAQPIVGNYNQRWLEVEYNAAVRVSRRANEWQKWEKQSGLYPNLKYLPSRAATPRDEHKPFYGVVRPINDSWWNTHLPPSAWNCQCGVEQTDEASTDIPTDGPKPMPGLDNNAGKTGEVFNLATVSYAKGQHLDQAGIDAAVQVERERVKPILKDALAGTSVHHPDLPSPVQFTMKGLKKVISQPHKHLLDVIWLLENGIQDAIKTGEYLGFAADYKHKQAIKGYHYLKIQVAGEDSFAVLRHDAQDNITLYTVMDHMHTK